MDASKITRRELRHKLIKEMRFVHDRLRLGENPLQNITTILDALITFHEVRMREKEHQK
jgi:hypothetical protein